MSIHPRHLAIEALIGWTLLVGVLLSVAFVTAGLAWHWTLHGDVTLDYTITSTTVREFLASALTEAIVQPRPRALVNLGLGLLLLTPYVRVLASLVYFAAVERDWKYTVFTAFVFTTLTYAMIR